MTFALCRSFPDVSSVFLFVFFFYLSVSYIKEKGVEQNNFFGDSVVALSPTAECLRCLFQDCQRLSAPRVKTSDYVIRESGSFAL